MRRSTGWLGERGSDSPRLDAELLLAHVLGTERLQLYLDPARKPAAAEVDAYRALVRRRGAGEPVAHLTGKKEFYGLEFEVTTDVLVPRPETELLVDRARALGGARLLDVGTGSGCVAIACAVRLPEARVTATDVSQAALEVAQRNAERHGVAERIDFRQGDLFAPVDAMDTSARFDLILSNPPYVATGETVETAGKEPDVALFAGPQGTEILERLLDAAPEHLAPGGTLLMEIGEDQAGFVEGRARASFGSVTIHADLAGLPRMLEASSPP
ncbi:MAG: peptide chain release factor N(5)-glutamine methyltransferase [Planctomycetota bacterium]